MFQNGLRVYPILFFIIALSSGCSSDLGQQQTVTTSSRSLPAISPASTPTPTPTPTPAPAPAPLVVSAGAAVSGFEGTAVKFNAMASGGVAPLTYNWNFGDGTTAVGTLTPAHAYSGYGTFTASITVTDAALNSTTSTVTATIANAPNLPQLMNTWNYIPTSMETSTFTASFDASPTAAALNEDAVIGLSATIPAAFTDLAVIVRFANYNGGSIDVINGETYTLTNPVPFTVGYIYHFRIEINVSAHTYNVYVTPPNQSEILLANSFAFRTEQITVTNLKYFSNFISVGSVIVSNFVIN